MASIISSTALNYLFLWQKQFQQRIKEQFAMLGDLPILRRLQQIAFGQRFVQRHADHAFIQPGIVGELGAKVRLPAGGSGS